MKSEQHCRVKTASSNLFTSSVLIEEGMNRYKYSWQMLDSAEQVKGIGYEEQIESEPVIRQEPQTTRESYVIDNMIQSGLVYKVRQMEFYYFKINLKNQKSPLNCQIQCEGDFQIMISYTNPYPTKFNCDQVIRSRNWIIKHNQEEFLYLSYISRKSTDVKFILKFGLQEHIKIIKQQPYPHQYTRRSSVKGPQDKINKNIQEQVKQINKFQCEVNRSNRNIRILRVAQTQRVISSQNHRSRQIDFQQKELAHEESIVKRLLIQKLNLKRQFEQFWIISIYQMILSNQIAQLFHHKKQIIQKNRMAAFKMRLKFRHIRQELTKQKGDTLEERTRVDCQMILKTYTRQIYKQIIIQQFRKVIPIMQERAILFDIKKRMWICYNKIQIIRRRFIQFLLRVKKYKQEMIIKWDQFIAKHQATQLKLKQSERDKRQMAWFLQLQDKGFNQLMQKNFLAYVIRERVRIHFYEQRLIKQMRSDIKEYRIKLTNTQDSIEIAIYKQRIFKLTSDLFALQMKTQLFIHSDVLKYMLILMDKYLIFQEDRQQVITQNQEKNKKSNKKVTKKAPGRLSIFKQT